MADKFDDHNNIMPCPPSDKDAGRQNQRVDNRRFQFADLAILMALAVALPIGVLFLSFLHWDGEIWQHLVDTLLAQLLTNTVVLTLGVLSGTAFIGIATAWLTAVCEFPGRKWFSWALLLPLAMPTYVLAFVFTGLMDFSGPIQTGLRGVWPEVSAWLPSVRSSQGLSWCGIDLQL